MAEPQFYSPALGLYGAPSPAVTTTITTIADREQQLLKGMSPKQVELVAELMTRVEEGELQKRAMMAKSVEAAETIGAGGAMGFVRGYYPTFQPGGFNPSLIVGLGLHGGALYAAHEGTTARDPKLLAYEQHLEHLGNGALSAYAFEEMRDVGQRLLAAKQAKAAAAKA